MRGAYLCCAETLWSLAATGNPENQLRSAPRSATKSGQWARRVANAESLAVGVFVRPVDNGVRRRRVQRGPRRRSELGWGLISERARRLLPC